MAAFTRPSLAMKSTALARQKVRFLAFFLGEKVAEGRGRMRGFANQRSDFQHARRNCDLQSLLVILPVPT
jgi:hypothetical protein